jgi:MFS transporter, DHA3 family, macrolide efflux protein
VQVPAVMASVSTLVPKANYSRAAGLLGMADTMSQILAPALAGMLYALIGVGGVLVIDIVTFVIAVVLMLTIDIPEPEITEIGQQSKGTLFQEGLFGFRFIFKHRHLLYLLLFIIAVNVVLELWATFLSPMILARTENNTVALGWVQAAGGIGAVVGGLLLSRLPSPKNYFPPLLFSIGVLGVLTLPISFKDALPLWITAHFLFFFLHAFMGTYHQSIWQSKVPQDVQGRVFAVRRLTFGVSTVFAPFVLGQIADKVFEPSIRVPGQINTWFAWLVGSQPGDGLAAMFVLGGFILTGLALLGYFIPALRNMEIELPDYQPQAQPGVS